jgi:hypothetical protein
MISVGELQCLFAVGCFKYHISLDLQDLPHKVPDDGFILNE